MDNNPFHNRYQSKSNHELQDIAASVNDYIIEARFAAVHILKERGEPSDFESSTIIEFEKHESGKQREDSKYIHSTEKIIKRLNQIPKGDTHRLLVNKVDELQIKRLNETRFRVRHEIRYARFEPPVMICEIKNDAELITYPFFSLRPLLFASLLSLVGLVVHFSKFYIFESWMVVMLPIATVLGIQLVAAPFSYFSTRSKFRRTLG